MPPIFAPSLYIQHTAFSNEPPCRFSASNRFYFRSRNPAGKKQKLGTTSSWKKSRHHSERENQITPSKTPHLETPQSQALRERESSDTRVILQEWRVGGVITVPVITVGCQSVEVHCRRDGAQLLKELHAQALRYVPGDVAMEEPRARIAGLICYGQPPPRRQHGSVAARWVSPAQIGTVYARVVRA